MTSKTPFAQWAHEAAHDIRAMTYDGWVDAARRGEAAPLSWGPLWQDIREGDRVRKKRGRTGGTVVAVILPLSLGGVPLSVAVRWDNRPQETRAYPTDGLVILDHTQASS